MFSAYNAERGQNSGRFVRPVRTSQTTKPMPMLAAAPPSAAMRMPCLPPILSTSGPFTRKEKAYTPVPIPKIMPKSWLPISGPSAFLATVRLYRPM
jgi:hypothetical protein